MKKIILILSLILIAQVGYSQLFSATDGVIITGGGLSNSSFTNAGRGFSFTPNSTITVTHLGKRVPHTTGNYTWVIWNVTSSTAVHTQASTNNISAAYNYEPISSPVVLTMGVQYILELYCDATPSNGYYFSTSSQMNSNLTYGQMRYCNSCGPTTFPINALSNYHYGTPDFAFFLGTTAPLPIKNNEISLGQSNNGFLLSWKTEGCNTNEHYLVQKSTDNETWTTLDDINCKPNTTLNYNDKNPTNGANYYRLKVVSLGESYSYTNTVRGNWNSRTDVTIFPNPAYNQVTVSYNASKASNAQVIVYDMLGKKVITKNYNNAAGINNINLNTSELAEGTYTIVVKENNVIIQKQTIQKLVK